MLLLTLGLFGLLISILVELIKFQREDFFTIPGVLDIMSKKIATVTMVAFCFGIIAVLFGVAAALMKPRAISIIFCVSLMPVAILFFVAANIIKPIYRYKDGLMLDSDLPLFKDYVIAVDLKINPYTTKWMCSKQCPCSSSQ